MTATALVDIVTYNRIIYARAGEKIKVLSTEFHPVIICENERKEKFFARVEKIKENESRSNNVNQ